MRTGLATVKIQAAFRGFLERQKYQRFQKNVQKAQAYVLQRQQRRAYLKLKQDTLRLQAYIKRYIAMSWYQKVKDQKQNLGQALQQINETIGKYNQEASRFKNEFTKDGVAELPRGLDHMTDFEGMQRKALDREKPGQPTLRAQGWSVLPLFMGDQARLMLPSYQPFPSSWAIRRHFAPPPRSPLRARRPSAVLAARPVSPGPPSPLRTTSAPHPHTTSSPHPHHRARRQA